MTLGRDICNVEQELGYTPKIANNKQLLLSLLHIFVINNLLHKMQCCRDPLCTVAWVNMIVLRRNCKQLYKSASGLALYRATGL